MAFQRDVLYSSKSYFNKIIIFLKENESLGWYQFEVKFFD